MQVTGDRSSSYIRVIRRITDAREIPITFAEPDWLRRDAS
jgi:hypothetical protein